MNFDITLEDNQGVPVGLRSSSVIPGGAVIYTSRRNEHNAVWFSRANAAQLWPIMRHYAETGELCETPPVAEDAPRIVSAGLTFPADWEKALGDTVKVSSFEARLAALEAQHAAGHAHRANEPHAFGAVPVCACGCSLDDHARDPQARAVVLGCEKCGACEKFESAELRYMEAT